MNTYWLDVGKVDSAYCLNPLLQSLPLIHWKNHAHCSDKSCNLNPNGVENQHGTIPPESYFVVKNSQNFGLRMMVCGGLFQRKRMSIGIPQNVLLYLYKRPPRMIHILANIENVNLPRYSFIFESNIDEIVFARLYLIFLRI